MTGGHVVLRVDVWGDNAAHVSVIDDFPVFLSIE